MAGGLDVGVAAKAMWRKVEERLSPMENALEAETELASGGGLACLVAEAKRSEAIGILRRKATVVDDR